MAGRPTTRPRRGRRRCSTTSARTIPWPSCTPGNDRCCSSNRRGISTRSARRSKRCRPRGGCDGPAAVGDSDAGSRQEHRNPPRSIVLSDGQRHGWADDAAILGWGQSAGKAPPRVWLVNLDPRRPADPPNRSVAPIRASRAVASAGQEITFRTALKRHGGGELPARPAETACRRQGRPATCPHRPRPAKKGRCRSASGGDSQRVHTW